MNLLSKFIRIHMDTAIILPNIFHINAASFLDLNRINARRMQRKISKQKKKQLFIRHPYQLTINNSNHYSKLFKCKNKNLFNTS